MIPGWRTNKLAKMNRQVGPHKVQMGGPVIFHEGTTRLIHISIERRYSIGHPRSSRASMMPPMPTFSAPDCRSRFANASLTSPINTGHSTSLLRWMCCRYDLFLFHAEMELPASEAIYRPVTHREDALLRWSFAHGPPLSGRDMFQGENPNMTD